MFQIETKILALALVLASAFSANARDTKAAAKHPIAQLVEWELTANSEMKKESLRRMADVVLRRADVKDILGTLTHAVNVNAYRRGTELMRKRIMDALTDTQLRQLVRSPVPIEYFEVPESRISAMGDRFNHEIPVEGLDRAKSYVKFQKDGVPYVRWFVHPLSDSSDSEFSHRYKRIFNEELKPQSGFAKAHFTSSRSVILFRNSYDDAISLKMGLTQAEGPFKNKRIHMKEFQAWSRHNIYLADTVPNGTSTMTLQREPYGIGLGGRLAGDGDEGFLFRSIGNKYYLPAFAALDEKVGAEIARRNGAVNPAEFWEKNLVEPLAKGMAELRANTGAEHTSPHSQNILVELDKDLRPTGKIALRDFDFYVDDFAYTKFNRMLHTSEGVVRPGTQMHQFALHNGLYTLPSWMSEKDYAHWIEKYFSTFADRYSAVSGVPRSTINTKVQKFAEHQFVPVEDGNYLVGGRNNFHAIQMQEGSSGFSLHNNDWISRRRAQMPASTLVLPEDPPPVVWTNAREMVTTHPTGQIANWDEFINQLLKAPNFDAFEGRLAALVSQAETMDLGTRTKLNERLFDFWSIRSKVANSSNPQALLEVATVLNELDPRHGKELFNNLPAQLRSHNANEKMITSAYRILEANERRALALRKIREGSARELPEAIKGAEALFDRPYQSVADSFVYRLKRTTDLEQKAMLAETLGRIGKGDETISAFLRNHIQDLPPEKISSLQHLLENRPPKVNVDCVNRNLANLLN